LLDVGSEDDDNEDHDVDAEEKEEEDDDENNQHEGGLDGWQDSSSLGLGITPSKLPRAKEKLQRRGLHVVGKVRATFLLKLGMSVKSPTEEKEEDKESETRALSHPVVADGSNVLVDCVCALDVS